MDATNQPDTNSGRILFADDDEQFRLGLGKRLQRAGFECDFAGSATEAVALLQSKEYDVLLSDINMPGNARLEMIENLPAIVAGLPVILITGGPTMETATRSVRLRVTAYLTKPPEFDELCQLLRVAVAECRDARIVNGSRRQLQDWDHDLAHIQKLLLQQPGPGRQVAMQSYLRLTVRNLVVGLVELEHLLIHEGGRLGTDQALEKQDLLKAVRKTIAVLEQTRAHFKSKELGELRKELEGLLGGG
ncbi:MAG TPA: response regulator [Candidatus Acidoferrales bacterium]|jgi:CheY-like chemotaxis protein|nr:response regulator [Candidatus Acidoferrales bacterium]